MFWGLGQRTLSEVKFWQKPQGGEGESQGYGGH